MIRVRNRRAAGRAALLVAGVIATAVIVAGVVAVGVPAARAADTDAGVDGEHIYAGISFDSYHALDRCRWLVPSTSYWLGARPGLTVRVWKGLVWYLYECEADGETTLVWVPDVDTETVAESARDVVRELVPTLDHGFSPPPDRGLVKTTTWFWVNPAVWRPVSVTARVPTPRGPLSVTTAATPSALEFDPGDGNGSVRCDGPGLAWSRLLPASVGSGCTYEYPQPSTGRVGGVFKARLEVVWRITWTTNAGASGRLPDLRTGTTHALRVRELHAVVQK